MYRRVELISRYKSKETGEIVHYKNGLMGSTTLPVVDAWIEHLRGPKHGVPWNAKFYFTEKGWKEVGRNVVKAAKKSGQEYRVIAIKETDAQVVWADKFTGYEVAIQPQKKYEKKKMGHTF